MKSQEETSTLGIASPLALLKIEAAQSQQPQQFGGVVSGQIHYVRVPSSSPEILVRPPSYHSDDEYVDPVATGRK
jgi:hypothetical protein